MKHINILIVDDDFAKISSIIKTIREEFSDNLSITQAQSVQEAIENLQKKEFHVLITDFLMPLRPGERPVDDGGIALIKSLYKKKNKINLPLYVVGLTQFPELKDLYNGVWKVWHYDPSEELWRNNIRDLIHHVSLIKSRVIAEKIETLFVEGTTDKRILEKAIGLIYPNLAMNINIETVHFGGGASWVERQLFIWAKSLQKKSGTADYLKAIGLFDNDEAGNKSIAKIRKEINPDSAEIKAFHIMKVSAKYSVLLKNIKAKGIAFPTAIEDLFPASLFKIAQKNNWLIARNPNHFEIDKNVLNLTNVDISNENLVKKNFTADEILITYYKVNDDFKEEFTKLALEIPEEDFQSIVFLLKDIFEKFKMIETV
jgi:CheY-like chemotaxis protein